MKIAVFCRVHELHGMGGMQYVATNIAKYLSKNHEVHYFTTSLGNNCNEIIDDNLVSHFVNCEPKKYTENYFDNSLDLFKKIDNFDVIYSHSTAARRFTEQKQIPVVAHWHGIATDRDETNRKKIDSSYQIRKIDFDKNILSYFNHIVIAPHEKNLLLYQIKLNQLNIDKFNINLIFNGVDSTFNTDCETDRQQIRNNLGIQESDFVIGFVGKGNNSKGLDFLVNSIEFNCPNLKLLIIGSEQYKSHKIISLPAQNNRDMPSFYAAMDLFVNPTILNQGFDTTNIEANQCGKTMLLSDIDKHIEVFNGTAYFFEIGNTQSLLDQIKKIQLSNNRTKAMHKKEFTIEFSCSKIEYMLNNSI